MSPKPLAQLLEGEQQGPAYGSLANGEIRADVTATQEQMGAHDPSSTDMMSGAEHVVDGGTWNENAPGLSRRGEQSTTLAAPSSASSTARPFQQTPVDAAMLANQLPLLWSSHLRPILTSQSKYISRLLLKE